MDCIGINNGEYEIKIGTEDKEFIFQIYKDNKLVIPDGCHLECSELLIEMAYQIQALQSKLKAIESGKEFPIVFLDKEHIDFTYQLAQYHKFN